MKKGNHRYDSSTARRIFAVLLSAVLLFSFTACGTKTTPEEDGTKSTETTTTTPPDNDTDGRDRTDTGSEPAGEDTQQSGWTWPLPERKELSIWLSWQNDYADNPNELKGIRQIEKNTNVKMNWIHVNNTEMQEKFGLMLASGDYPDIIRAGSSYYAGGLAAMCDDGVSIDLTDLIPIHMPTYQSLRTSIDSLERDTKTDDGRLLAVYTLASHNGTLQGEKIWFGQNLRRDWLEEQNLEPPVTIDDWHNVLTVFKNEYGCEAPLMVGTNGYDFGNTFTSAYGVLYGMYKDGDTVKYGPAEDGYRQWVELFRQWYAEGLIDPNFSNGTSTVMAPFEYMGTGRAGAGLNIWDYTAEMIRSYGYTDDEDYYLLPVPAPVLNEGDTPQFGFATSDLIKENLVISKNCKDVELALRYLDYWYTEECMLLDSYGIRGESYDVDANGNYYITDKIYKQVEDGEYPTVLNAINMYNLNQSDFGLYNWARFDVINAGNDNIGAQDIWNAAKFDLLLPTSLTLTAEEAAATSTIYTDIQTLVNESTVKFITGQTSMDEYDTFLNTMKQYGLDKVISAYQAAYDRYLAR